ncbi:MAG: glycosyltransferase [Candidatus Methanomethylicaceae archaeon]
MLRSVLIVAADAFHLGWMGSTRRIFHLTKAFKQLGFEVVLLAGRATNPSVQLKIDRVFPGLVIRTPHSGDYPKLVDCSPFTRRLWRGLWKIRGDEIYWSKLSWGWAKRLDTEWVYDQLNKLGLNLTAIWVILGGHLWDAVAASRLAKTLSIPWIFEIEDPPWGAGIGKEKTVIINKYRELLSDAKLIVVIADSYRDILMSQFGVQEKRICTVYLTYDEKEIPLSIENALAAQFTILYSGSLEGKRSIKPLLLALQQAADKEPGFASACRLVLAGKGSGFKEAEQFVKQMQPKFLVEFLGLVSGEEALRLLRSSFVSIVVQPDDFRYQVPGKLYTYLLSHKPIIGIMPADCEAATILRRSRIGFVHESEDVEGLTDTLLTLWQAWRDGRSVVEPDNEYIEQFSFKYLPERLRYVMQQVGVF